MSVAHAHIHPVAVRISFLASAISELPNFPHKLLQHYVCLVVSSLRGRSLLVQCFHAVILLQTQVLPRRLPRRSAGSGTPLSSRISGIGLESEQATSYALVRVHFADQLTVVTLRCAGSRVHPHC